MAKVLVEVAQFDQQIVVPQGADSRQHAAEDVEAIAQSLSNRTRYLINLMNDAAQRSLSNTFSQLNRFTSLELSDLINFTGASAARAHVSSGVEPYRDPTNSSNCWKLILEQKVTGGQYLYVYAGSNFSTLGNVAIVCNAIWSIANQKWSRRDGAYGCSAVILSTERARVVTLPSGSDEWLEWGDRERSIAVPLSSGLLAPIGTVLPSYAGAVDVDLISVNDASAESAVVFPLDLPHGANVLGVHIIHKQQQSNTPNKVSLIAKKVSAYADGATVLGTKYLDNAVDQSGTGNTKHSTWSPAVNVTWPKLETDTLSLKVQLMQSGNNVQAVKVRFSDPGPSNF
jgi:hypothetical protein